MTCEVISQPPAQSSGVATAHSTRSTGRIGIDSAWATPTTAPVTAPMTTRLAESVWKSTALAPAAEADGEAARRGHRSSAAALAGGRSRRCRPARPEDGPAGEPAEHRRAEVASMLPATARAATPASGNPMKVAEPTGPIA